MLQQKSRGRRASRGPDSSGTHTCVRMDSGDAARPMGAVVRPRVHRLFPAAGAAPILLGALLVLLLGALLPAAPALAQYFGKNKVQYNAFEWRIIKTEHFEVYYYPSEAEAAKDAARMAERTYARLSHVLRHEFDRPIPLILYASHSQFQQTNILPDLVDEGTGGVTEAIKRRVFLPFTGSYAELEHVLAHELVHAFQYDVLYGSNRNAIYSPLAFNAPLWFMEGMAEYLSLGGVDPNTEMWLRDGALEGYLTPLSQLEYVYDIRVYRYGQSIWEFIARTYGEDKIGQILRKAARMRNASRAIEMVTGVTAQKISEAWIDDVRVTYLPQVARFARPGKVARVLTKHETDNSNFNVVPALSPTGDKVAFISDRALATSLYLASAIDGKNLGRLVKGERTARFEQFRFFTSAIDWSPDGTRIAFPAKAGGSDAIYILEVKSKDVKRKLTFPDLDAITSPTWSPDGTQLVFVGYAGGLSDLYRCDIDGGNLERLTADRFAERDPSYSPDGTKILFATDRDTGTDFDRLTVAPLGIAVLSLSDRTIEPLPGMSGKNISPFWSPDGSRVIYVSDRTGIPNLFVQHVAGDSLGHIRQVTDLLTGVSGITDGSPPLTVSRDGNRLVFSAFQRGGWDLFALKNPFHLPALTPKPDPTRPVLAAEPAAETRTGGGVVDLAIGAGASDSSSAPVDSLVAGVVVPDGPRRGAPGGLERVAVDIVPAPPLKPDTLDLRRMPPGREPPPDPNDLMPRHLLELRRTTDAPRAMTVAQRDSLRAAMEALPDTNTFLDRPYKSRLTPDYASTGALYGSNIGLAGAATLSFSDMLGNKNLNVSVGVYGNLLDSDVFVQYSDLGRRSIRGVNIYQYRNDYYLGTRPNEDEFESEIYRGAEVVFYRPFSKFDRLEFSIGGVAIDRKVFVQSFYDYDQTVIDDKATYFYANPTVAFVHDTAVYGGTGPIDGARSRLEVMHAQGGLEFTNVTLDHRIYNNIGGRFCFALRGLVASSAGAEPRIFRIGGPFTARSVDYGEIDGSHVLLTNAEFRFPFIDRLRTAFPLPLDWPGLRGVLFLDTAAGWGWRRGDIGRTEFRPFSTEGGFHLQDLTAAYGFGIRMNLGFIVLRYDIAQPTNFKEDLGKAWKFFSIGYDF